MHLYSSIQNCFVICNDAVYCREPIEELKLQLCVLIVSVAGPPDPEDPFDGNRDDPVFMETNEGASCSQDSDQNSSKYHEIL